MNRAERAADRRSAIPAISIQVVDAEREFAALCGDWEKLTGLSGARVYQSFDWQWLWWRHFGDGLALHIIVLRRDGEAIGLAPFYLATEALCGVRYRRCLRLLGSPVRVRERSGVVMTYDPSDYLDIIVHPEYVSPVIQALAEHLRDHAASCDAIELVNVPDESMAASRSAGRARMCARGYTFRPPSMRMCARSGPVSGAGFSRPGTPRDAAGCSRWRESRTMSRPGRRCGSWSSCINDGGTGRDIPDCSSRSGSSGSSRTSWTVSSDETGCG